MTDPAVELSCSERYHTKKYFEILSKAIPASGYRPQTEREWRRLQRAMRAAAPHFYQAAGAPKGEAKRLAHLIYGGAAGRMFLEAAFTEPEHGEVAR